MHSLWYIGISGILLDIGENEKMFSSNRGAFAQNRKCSTQRHIIPGGRGIRKRTRAPNRGQFTPISGAEVLSAPPLSLR